jgi:hypothetical protein
MSTAQEDAAKDCREGIAPHVQWYQAYADRLRSRCPIDPEPIDLKRKHTLAVLGQAADIATAEGLSPCLTRACLLAALYHDVGRFEQYLRHGTFKDRESCNHAFLGMKILREEHRLDGERRPLADLVRIGVCLHNRFVLPPSLSGDAAVVAWVVRDADKLDILRVIHAHLEKKPYNPTVVLSLPDAPDISGEAVCRAVMDGRVAAYGDLTCVNDMRLLLGSWLFDMHFPSSRRRFREDGHAAAIIGEVPARPPFLAPRNLLLDRLAKIPPEQETPLPSAS